MTAGSSPAASPSRPGRAALAGAAVLVGLGLLPPLPAAAHEPWADPVYGELNGYLAALPALRDGGGAGADGARALLERWQGLRQASWRFRTLTEDDGLPVDAPAVVDRVERARSLRSELLAEARAFFASQTASWPTVRVRLGEPLQLSWPDPQLAARVGRRDPVLVELTNPGAAPARVELAGDGSDQVLIWDKGLEVEPGGVRYEVVQVAPTRAGAAASTLRVRSGPWAQAEARIRILADDPEPAAEAGRGIRFEVRDPQTGEPVPVRAEVRDAAGKAYWGPLGGPACAVEREGRTEWETPLWQVEPGPYLYAGPGARLDADPAGKRVRLFAGFEREPVSLEVPADGVVRAAPRRWIDMPGRGWYPGQTHIHTTATGAPVRFSRHWPLVARAEGLAVSAVLTLKGESPREPIYANEYPMGRVAHASDPAHLVVYGEEYRSNPYGHLALIGLPELLEPISSGALGELAGPDYPPNAFVLDSARRRGAVAIGAHFGNYILTGGPVRTPWPSTGFEMPVDVALGLLEVAEVYGNGGQLPVWYGLLNCGFEVAATAGPDWVIADTPRTYVYLGSAPLTQAGWLEGLRRGASFVTRGPMLLFTVDGERPGARLHWAGRPAAVVVQARALLPSGPIPVEIVVNGQVVARGTDLAEAIELEDSAWIAARCEGAHTSPVYVTLAGRPRGSAAAAAAFLPPIDALAQWVRTKGLFDSPEQRETVLSVLERGRAVYAGLAAREAGP